MGNLLNDQINESWSLSLVDSSGQNNDRLISSHPYLAKILESLVNVQLCSFLPEKCILNVNQSGFRPGHSTITATTLVVNDLVNSLDTKMKCAALFENLSKAFDTVDHAISLNKLSSIGLSSDTCSWLS
jgi:hypothetical protein